MKTIPLQKRYAIGLVALGYTEVKPTTRFRVFTKHSPELTNPIYIYVGAAGALRYNRTGKVSLTFDTTQKFKDRVLSNPAVPTHEHRGFAIRDIKVEGLS